MVYIEIVDSYLKSWTSNIYIKYIYIIHTNTTNIYTRLYI